MFAPREGMFQRQEILVQSWKMSMVVKDGTGGAAESEAMYVCLLSNVVEPSLESSVNARLWD